MLLLFEFYTITRMFRKKWMKNAMLLKCVVWLRFKFHLFTYTNWICWLFLQYSLCHTLDPNDQIVWERWKRPTHRFAYNPCTPHNKWTAVCWWVAKLQLWKKRSRKVYILKRWILSIWVFISTIYLPPAEMPLRILQSSIGATPSSSTSTATLEMVRMKQRLSNFWSVL